MNIILLLTMLLLVGCGGQESGTGTCHELYADCPGVAEDYRIAESASDMKQNVVMGERFFTYYNCELGYRTPTIIIGVECKLVDSDPR